MVQYFSLYIVNNLGIKKHNTELMYFGEKKSIKIILFGIC